jgi:MFS family permease
MSEGAQPVGSPVRNIALLAAAQATMGSNQAILMSIAALTAAGMVTDKAFATVPVTLMIIGTALATGPAAWLIHSWGRRNGLAFGAAIAIPGALLAAFCRVDGLVLAVLRGADGARIARCLCQPVIASRRPTACRRR